MVTFALLEMGSRILVVDDSQTIRRVVSTILERHGYDPLLASDGQDALDVLTSGEVKADLVLVDFVMPRMNGFQFCRALRENVELAGTPVVLMSAKADRIRDQFVQQTGALDAISKPFEPQALVTVVENALHRVNNQARASSARLPEELEPEPETSLAPSFDADTKRTHVSQIVATKLAHVVSRVLVDKPQATPGELAQLLGERLANEAIVDMIDALRDLDQKASILAGDLGVIPIGAVLQLLQAEAQTGVLTCRSDGAEVTATFRSGLLDLVQSSGAGDEFRLGRYFVEEGIVTPTQIDELLRRSKPPDDPGKSPKGDDPGKSPKGDELGKLPKGEEEAPRSHVVSREASGSTPTLPAAIAETIRDGVVAIHEIRLVTPRLLGAALLETRRISERQLKAALGRQSSELLYEVIRWPRGRFDFRRRPPEEAATSARLGMPVASVVMEGFRRVDEWRVLEHTIGSFDTVLVKDEVAVAALHPRDLDDREQRLIAAVDGERSVRQLVQATSMSSFDTCRTIVSCLEARVLRKR